MAQAPLSLKSGSFIGTLFLTLITVVFIAPQSASAQDDAAGWTLCNRTSYIVEAAAAYQEGTGIVVNGWTRLAPGSCEPVLQGPLRPGVHFLYAQSSRAHRGGYQEWKGDRALCVDATGSFSVESKPDCRAWGLDARLFRPVAIEDETSWLTELTETNTYSLERARTAGIQRLLRDIGVLNRAIDGIEGAGTRRGIARFLANQNIETPPGDDDLIDILEQAAIDRGRNIGLTLCNRTPHKVWGAMARLKGEGWESRGWWGLDAGGCARVIDEELIATQYFVFAELEAEDEPTRVLARGADRFCVARAQFAITGRENCAALGYRPALFVSTKEPEDGRLVFEFFERDFVQAEN